MKALVCLGIVSGDILAVRPKGFDFGDRAERLSLIVEMDLGSKVKTIADAKKLTLGNHYVDLDELVKKAKAKKKKVDLEKVQSVVHAYQPLKGVSLSGQGLVRFVGDPDWRLSKI